MHLFKNYIQTLSLLLVLFISFTGIHLLFCLDIHSLKIAIHSISTNYLFFKIIYPIIFAFLSINMYIYYLSFDSNKYIYIFLGIYILILLLLTISSFLVLKHANFIFAFWIVLLSFLLSFSFIYYIKHNYHSYYYFSYIPSVMIIYLDIIYFWFYIILSIRKK